MGDRAQGGGIRRFERDFFSAEAPFTYIGDGELGGKATGLAGALQPLARLDGSRFEGITVGIPHLVVVTTSLFDAFMQRNELWETALDDLPDERMANAFMRAELPIELGGDLRSLVQEVHQPLAVRSSSLLEDAMGRPLAGVYATKMTPNNQLDVDSRFRKLAEAVKLVWASTFFRDAKSYRAGDRRAGCRRADGGGHPGGGRLAVRGPLLPAHRRGRPLVQLLRHGQREALRRGGNPGAGARQDDRRRRGRLGVLAGLPKAPPPYNSIGELLKSTQTGFWAVNMGPAPAYDPLTETEWMVKASLADAEADDTLRFVASTFDPQSNRITPSLSVRGPRLVNFAPVLSYGVAPVNEMLRELLRACEEAVGSGVEIELAVVLDPRGGTPARCGFLQVRALAGGTDQVDVPEEDLQAPGMLVASERVLGNGLDDDHPGRGVRQAGGVRGRADPDRGAGAGGAQRAAARGRPAVPADRLRPLGDLRPDRRRARHLGPDRRGQGHRRGQPAGDAPGHEPGLPLLPQPHEPGRDLLLGRRARREHRLELARGAAGRVGDDDPAPPRAAAPLSVRVDGRTGRGVVRRG